MRGKCQFNEMHKKMQINTLNKRILEIIPKLAGIPLHLQHFLGVAAGGGGGLFPLTGERLSAVNT